ncbi:uncharacterized protein RSE6_09386 [Rhynchosporium secalis]|uniref:Uncharacterized protein n=1 Tax=Rhynchosporium secalis TaxID=38038 RepID=A0A1E1MHW1_RHYSE|nr:uncharacterized protein RSE6_09386 [Rhynchosporium secalis]
MLILILNPACFTLPSCLLVSVSAGDVRDVATGVRPRTVTPYLSVCLSVFICGEFEHLVSIHVPGWTRNTSRRPDRIKGQELQELRSGGPEELGKKKQRGKKGKGCPIPVRVRRVSKSRVLMFERMQCRPYILYLFWCPTHPIRQSAKAKRRRSRFPQSGVSLPDIPILLLLVVFTPRLHSLEAPAPFVNDGTTTSPAHDDHMRAVQNMSKTKMFQNNDCCGMHLPPPPPPPMTAARLGLLQHSPLQCWSLLVTVLYYCTYYCAFSPTGISVTL